MIGRTAAEAEQILKNDGCDAFDQIFLQAMWKTYIFRIRAKLDTYTVILLFFFVFSKFGFLVAIMI